MKSIIQDIKAMDEKGLIGKKYGCLEILDNGLEFIKHVEAKIEDITAEKIFFIKAVQENKLQHDDWYGWDGDKEVITPAFKYKPRSFDTYHTSINVNNFDEAILSCEKNKNIFHYKCRCKSCGKVRYYTIETLRTNPKYCFRPMYCSSSHTYSIRAQDATYRKKLKYENDESVQFVYDKEKMIPSTEYCDKWNDKREKELKKQAEKDAVIIASLPRKYAKNYDTNFSGTKYESLEVIECIDDKLESIPMPHYNQRHQKLYGPITVFKQYKCRCYLCGKEHIITCDQFGIFPPTQYGYRAYGGYWSEVYCDCHHISSFQWIVNDILMKHNVDYLVEVAVEGLFGIDEQTPLRFDFAVYKEGRLLAYIECQGEQHFMPVEEFGGERRFIIQKRNDEEKRLYAQEHDIKLIEITYKNKKYDAIEAILKSQNII